MAAEHARVASEFSLGWKGDVEVEMYLFKRGALNSKWKKRYFILYSSGTLRYYTSDDKSLLKGNITVKNGYVESSPSQNEENFPFKVEPQKSNRTYQLAASSEEDRTTFLAALERVGCDGNKSKTKGEIVMSGMLTKLSSEGTWKRRHVILRDRTLQYFSHNRQSSPVGSVELSPDITLVAEPLTAYSHPYVFSIQLANKAKPGVFYAMNELERKEWIKHLEEAAGVVKQKKVSSFNVFAKMAHVAKPKSLPWTYHHTRDLEGYLLKRGGIRKNWKRRFFVLSEGRLGTLLSYFEEEKDASPVAAGQGIKPLGDVVVDGGHVVARGAYDSHSWVFTFQPRTSSRKFYFAAPTKVAFEAWMAKLEKAAMKRDLLKGTSSPIIEVVSGFDSGLVVSPINSGLDVSARQDELSLSSDGDGSDSDIDWEGYRAKLSVPMLDNILGVDENSIKEGWLEKMGEFSAISQWKNRFFILTPDCVLSYYTTKPKIGALDLKETARGHINLRGCQLEERGETKRGRENVFVINPHRSKRTFYLAATTAQERKDWCGTIRRQMQQASSHTNAGHQREGFLKRLLDSAWEQYYYVLLDSGDLQVFNSHNTEEETPLDEISVENSRITILPDDEAGPNCFHIHTDDYEPAVSWTLQCPDKQSLATWVRLLGSAPSEFVPLPLPEAIIDTPSPEPNFDLILPQLTKKERDEFDSSASEEEDAGKQIERIMMRGSI